MIDTIITVIFGVLLIVFAVLAVNSKKIVHSAVWLMFFLFTIAASFIFLGASLVGAIELLVFVGAIVTLFVFTLMLTGGKEVE
ncbi:MAG: NADH dehydrogenase [Thermoplasmatales archaeon B_DKE]|nr:MAG: NADH dehydrogenase [Thermoplasmatales archaeon B_DKE]QRF74735.1 NADH dehydrogenase subunit J [Thermoplasmatales archaeon]